MDVRDDDTTTDDSATAADVETPSAAEPVSMEDTIRESLRSIQARDPEGAEGDPTPDGGEVTPPAEGEAPPAAKAETRDPKTGKFVKGKPAKPEGAAAPTAGEAPAADGQAVNTNPDNLAHIGQDGKQYPVDITKAPASWRPDAKAAFDKLPEAVRREVYKRENDFHRGLSESRGWASIGQTLDKELRPYEALIRARGVPAQKVVATLMNNAYTFASGTPEQKADLLLQVVEDYGITPQSVAAAQQRRAKGQPAVSPEVAGLHKRLDEVTGKLTAKEAAEERAANDDAMNRASAFLADPKNEFVQEIYAEMSRMLQTGGAQTLEEAYDKACWTSPTIKPKLIARQQAAEAKRKADEAAQARQAAGANVTRRGKPPAVQPTGTMDDTIRSALRRLRASQ